MLQAEKNRMEAGAGRQASRDSVHSKARLCYARYLCNGSALISTFSLPLTFSLWLFEWWLLRGRVRSEPKPIQDPFNPRILFEISRHSGKDSIQHIASLSRVVAVSKIPFHRL